jgi:hypothetical protein
MPAVLEPLLHGEELERTVIRQSVSSRVRVQRAPIAAVDRRPCPRWRWKTFLPAALIAAVIGAALLARGRGYKTTLMRYLGSASEVTTVRPSMIISRPRDGASNVAPDSAITVKLFVPHGAIDRATLDSSSVRLVRKSDGVPVAVALTLTPDGNTLDVRPNAWLEPDTTYTLQLTSALKDLRGAEMTPASVNFTTGVPADGLIRFEKVALPTTAGVGFTCVQAGPDGHVWAGSDDGRIFRFPVNADGTLGTPRVITSLQSFAGGRRLLTGFCFDPASTPTLPIVWVSHGHYSFANAPDLSGRLSRLSGGPDLPTVQDIVVRLPRSVRDHLNNQPVFGPDGAVYFGQGSNSAYGAADDGWGNRGQRLLNATILRLDTRLLFGGRIKLPLDAATADAGGAYDPFAPGAPLTIYASGVRQAWDLLWHSNGRLYAPVNGSDAGGNTPAGHGVPALRAIPDAEHDWLLRITPGRYYGHPNSVAGHVVLNGGNPTSHPDPGEIRQYPVGTRPDPQWEPPVYDFGTHVSADGVIEYRNRTAFEGRLAGRLIVCRYNAGSDLLALTLAADGSVDSAIVGIPGFRDLANPLDLTEDVGTGNLYVSEYGASRLTLLRPQVAHMHSSKEFR